MFDGDGVQDLAAANSNAASAGVLLQLPDAHSWTGNGTDAKWSTAANWNTGSVPGAGDSLTLSGSSRSTNQNDLSALSVKNVTSSKSGFAVTGNAVTLSGDISCTAGAEGRTGWGLATALGTNTHTVTVASWTLTMSGALTGSGALTKGGADTLVLSSARGFSAAAGAVSSSSCRDRSVRPGQRLTCVLVALGFEGSRQRHGPFAVRVPAGAAAGGAAAEVVAAAGGVDAGRAVDGGLPAAAQVRPLPLVDSRPPAGRRRSACLAWCPESLVGEGPQYFAARPVTARRSCLTRPHLIGSNAGYEALRSCAPVASDGVCWGRAR